MNQVSAELVSLFYTACWAKREHSVYRQRHRAEELFFLSVVKGKMVLGISKTDTNPLCPWTPPQRYSLVFLHKTQANQYPSKRPSFLDKMTSLIERLGPADCCVIKATPLLSNLTVSLTFLPSWGHPRPQTRFSGMPSKPRRSGFAVRDRDRRRRRRGRPPGQRDQCWKRNVNLLDGPARRYHRQQWVRGAGSDLSSGKIVSHQFPSACFCVYFFFQFQEAGGAPRGWITLCTVLMFWPPSPPWLCLTFSTPPTGSPPMWQLLFSGRWAHWFFSPAASAA